MKPRTMWTVLSLLVVGAIALTGCGQAALPTGPITIQLWHQEGEAENAAQYVQALADAYTAEHPNVTFEVTNPGDTELLRQDFQTAALAGSPPCQPPRLGDRRRGDNAVQAVQAALPRRPDPRDG